MKKSTVVIAVCATLVFTVGIAAGRAAKKATTSVDYGGCCHAGELNAQGQCVGNGHVAPFILCARNPSNTDSYNPTGKLQSYACLEGELVYSTRTWPKPTYDESKIFKPAADSPADPCP